MVLLMGLVALDLVTAVCEIKLLPITEESWTVRFDSWLERWDSGLEVMERRDLPWRSQFVVHDVPSSVLMNGVTALGVAHNVPLRGKEFDDVLDHLDGHFDCVEEGHISIGETCPEWDKAKVIKRIVIRCCKEFLRQLTQYNPMTGQSVLAEWNYEDPDWHLIWVDKMMSEGSDDLPESRLTRK